MSTALALTDPIAAKIDRARQLLMEARDVGDAKKVADLARAAEVYARRARLGQEAIDYAHAIKVDAERLMGAFLRETERNRGTQLRGRGPVGGTPRVLPKDTTTKLAELGVSKKESARAQLLADLPAPEFAKVRAGTKTVAQVKRDRKEATRETRREVNRAKVETTAPVRVGVARFATIVLDPPWDWGDEGDADQLGRARPEYATMSIDQIAALPVADLADVDCHVYLWITNRSLPKGFDLLDRWGFRYVTCLTWCKPSIGMGNYFRGSTEQILFGVKGSQPLKRKDVGTWFHAPRGERHSAKPAEAYALIESCSPGPYLDMFARTQRPGWAVWGADAP